MIFKFYFTSIDVFYFLGNYIFYYLSFIIKFERQLNDVAREFMIKDRLQNNIFSEYLSKNICQIFIPHLIL